MRQILTLTLNPSIDKTVFVDPVILGAQVRAHALSDVEGGKGVNVARALEVLNVAAESLTLTDILPLVPERVNTSFVEPSGRITRVLEPGPRLTARQWRCVETAVLKRLDGVRILALCGSLPGGAPADLYARLIRAARRNGILTILDTSGAALAAGVNAKPWCAKPNQDEAEALLGFRIRSSGAVRKALQMLCDYGMTRVLLSLGERGLAGFDGETMVLARVPVIGSGFTAGCGDAALAGFLAAVVKERSFTEAVAWAAAAGSANAGSFIPGAIKRKAFLSMRGNIRMERI
jgi:1-phosphofructokinase family hexose kinase